MKKGSLKIDNIVKDDQNDVINLIAIFHFSLLDCNQQEVLVSYHCRFCLIQHHKLVISFSETALI